MPPPRAGARAPRPPPAGTARRPRAAPPRPPPPRAAAASRRGPAPPRPSRLPQGEEQRRHFVHRRAGRRPGCARSIPRRGRGRRAGPRRVPPSLSRRDSGPMRRLCSHRRAAGAACGRWGRRDGLPSVNKALGRAAQHRPWAASSRRLFALHADIWAALNFRQPLIMLQAIGGSRAARLDGVRTLRPDSGPAGRRLDQSGLADRNPHLASGW